MKSSGPNSDHPLTEILSEYSSQKSSERLTPRERLFQKKILIYLLPNFFTTVNLFCGFYSVVSAMRGEWTASAWMIILAALFDGVDGRVARLTNTQSEFGEQYDSMSDLVSFGMAPSVLMFQWSLSAYDRMGLAISFFYLCCAALRLARFNVLAQSLEKRYFQGLPSPLAAGTIASAVLFYDELVQVDGMGRNFFMLAVVFSLAAAMISTMRYRSFKDMPLKSQKSFGIVILILLIVLVLGTAPERSMFPIAVAYFASGILGEIWRLARRHRRGPRAFPGRT